MGGRQLGPDYSQHAEQNNDDDDTDGELFGEQEAATLRRSGCLAASRIFSLLLLLAGFSRCLVPIPAQLCTERLRLEHSVTAATRRVICHVLFAGRHFSSTESGLSEVYDHGR